MNPKDIQNMEAGREMDALIAEKIFGWVWVVDDATYMNVSGKRQPSRNLAEPVVFSDVSWCWDGKTEIPIDNSRAWFPNYSTKIKPAWLVVEKLMRESHHSFYLDSRGDHLWDCHFQQDSMDNTQPGCLAADTAPLAICRAALKAVASQQTPEPQQRPQ